MGPRTARRAAAAWLPALTTVAVLLFAAAAPASAATVLSQSAAWAEGSTTQSACTWGNPTWSCSIGASADGSDCTIITQTPGGPFDGEACTATLLPVTWTGTRARAGGTGPWLCNGSPSTGTEVDIHGLSSGRTMTYAGQELMVNNVISFTSYGAGFNLGVGEVTLTATFQTGCGNGAGYGNHFSGAGQIVAAGG
jgi:hypothetical protein